MYFFLYIIEINSLKELKPGIFINPKEVSNQYHIDIMIEKDIVGIDSEKARKRVPKIIVFLLVILPGYPNIPPEILTKSNFSVPSLMDGRDLLNEICPNWNIKSRLRPIIEGILPFLSKVINAAGYRFYGMFHLGATYNLKNFDNMIVGKYYSKFYLNIYLFSYLSLYH